VNILKLRQFNGERTDELSMVRVAKAVLEEKGEVMDFQEIVDEVADFIDIDEEEKKRRMPQFYTDMNVDGEFISLGENTWGLRNWYPVDSIDEVLTHENDEEDIVPTIDPQGFDDYEEAAVEDEFKDEADEDEEEADDVVYDADSDGTVESLDEFADDANFAEEDLEDMSVIDEEDIDSDEIFDDDEEDEDL